MTREEFMKHAEAEIDQAFRGQRNRMMNLVEQAWAEGKRNAELNGVIYVVREAFDKIICADGESKTACDGCENKGSEDCALGKPGSDNAYCPNGKLR